MKNQYAMKKSEHNEVLYEIAFFIEKIKIIEVFELIYKIMIYSFYKAFSKKETFY